MVAIPADIEPLFGIFDCFFYQIVRKKQVIIQAEVEEGDEIKVDFDKENTKIKIDFVKAVITEDENKEEGKTE